MERLLKKSADDQQLTDLQQKSQQINQVFTNIQSELQQVLPMLQDQLMQTNGGLVGINAQELTNSINSFLNEITNVTTV